MKVWLTFHVIHVKPPDRQPSHRHCLDWLNTQFGVDCHPPTPTVDAVDGGLVKRSMCAGTQQMHLSTIWSARAARVSRSNRPAQEPFMFLPQTAEYALRAMARIANLPRGKVVRAVDGEPGPPSLPCVAARL